jgi:hypothetical protein
MTGWASKAAATTLALLAAPVMAQPVQLIPGQRPAVPAIVQPAQAPAGPAEPAESPAASPGAVEVAPLQAPDPSAVGTLTDGAEGSYGVDLWRGSTRAQIERLIPLLEPARGSAATRRMQVRLLRTAAAVPAGQPTVKSLLGLRVERLVALGQVQAGLDLAQLAPPTLSDPRLARAAADAAWLRGDTAAGCALAQRWVREDLDPYWLKAGFLCRVAENDFAAAALSLTLLREQGIDDPGFLTLADLLVNPRAPKLESLTRPSPLNLALLRASKRPVPADAYADAPPAVQAALLDLPGGEPDLRVAAAEGAVATGALAGEALAKAYAAVPFSTDEKRDPAATAAKLETNQPRVRALLYQAAAAQSVPVARAEALRRAWAQAARGGRLPIMVEATAPLARELTPSEELGFAGADLFRALLATGDLRAARQWYAWARARPAEVDTDAAALTAGGWPLILLTDAGGSAGFDAARWEAWAESQKDVAAPVRERRAVTFLFAAEALGYAVPDSAWAAMPANLATAERAPSPVALRGLQRAAEANRRGETVLYAALVLGRDGPAGLDPAALGTVIPSLRKVGLENDARALALEAALARGL